MNQLSQLLYFGNVLNNLSVLLVILGLGLSCASVGFFAMYYTGRADWLNTVKYNRRDEPLPEFLKWNIGGPVCLFFVILCWIGAAFCPSQETVYAIAASQMGEQALKTPIATKAGKALEVWLDKQIAPSTPSKQE